MQRLYLDMDVLEFGGQPKYFVLCPPCALQFMVSRRGPSSSFNDTIVFDGMRSLVPHFQIVGITYHDPKHRERALPFFLCLIEIILDTVTTAYGLLPGFTADFYQRFFNAIKVASQRKRVEWAPKYAVVDFEAAIHLALRTVFPQIAIIGCLFHLYVAWDFDC